MFPNTYIIGAPKCGTTSLAEYLSEHPRVFLSNPKEPNYWTREFYTDEEWESPERAFEYHQLYSGASSDHSVVLDASTSYFWSEHALGAILEHSPDARFILMVRNPLELAPSLHSEELFACHEDVADFNEAWEIQDRREKDDLVPRNGVCWQQVGYRYIGSLGTHLESVLKIVPSEHLKTIVFDDFVRDTKNCHLDVLRFLDLEVIPLESYKQFNARKQHFCPRLSELILHPPRPIAPIADAVKNRLHRLGIKGLRSNTMKLAAKRASAPAITERTRESMREYFDPEIRKLGSLLGRDLGHWLEN